MKTQRQKFGHKILTLLLALTLVLTGMPLGIFHSGVETADAAKAIVGTLDITPLSNYKLVSNKYMEIFWAKYNELKVDSDGSCTDGGLRMNRYDIKSRTGYVDTLVFCVEHGVTQKNSTKLKATEREDSFVAKSYENSGYNYAIDNIFSVLFYGPVAESTKSELVNELGFKDSKYYRQNGEPTMGAWIAATQCLIWESQQLMRDKDFKRRQNGLHYQTSWHGTATTPISESHYFNNIKGTPAADIYNFMASKIREDRRFDRNIASSNESAPTEISIPEDATFPYVAEIKAASNAGNFVVVDDKGKIVEDIEIVYTPASGTEKGKYTVTIKDDKCLNKTLRVKHNEAAARRAARYKDGENKQNYRQYFWEYDMDTVHTQGFVSGLEDPAEGFFKVVKGAPTAPTSEGECTPPDVEVFPTVYMPIDKIDANSGFDGDNHTPMGDAGLDATYTFERSINGGAWETIDTTTLDDYGSEYIFSDTPFETKEDLEAYLNESGNISGCHSHPILDGEGNVIGYEHQSMSREPAKREWNVTVKYRITETRPDGRYIDPDPYQGVREYSFTYYAETEDTCTQYCDDLPWTDVEYTFTYGATTGDGSMKVEGPSTDPKTDLDCDLETFKNDVMRGRIHIIKSNEKENPFKDSPLGGSDSNISQNSLWTVQLKSKGFEGSEYIHLVSATPIKLPDGTNVYKVSRDPGAVVNNGANPMKVGTSGEILLEDVPYGEYIVTEVSADNPKYVLEQFTVVVSEHNGQGSGTLIPFGGMGSVPTQGLFAGYGTAGTNPNGATVTGTGDYYNNTYDVNLRDKIKSNQIQLQKVDSETGKIIRLAGTKVFIRYKGNPDYSDEENQAMFGPSGTVARNTYNRFLPNAESINSASHNYTFELDENGCFDIPYQLPYGKYEILEWLLPEGYYVGQYDETGTASSHNFGFITEGQFTVDADTHGYNGTVPYNYAIRDAEGNKVTYKDADSYSFDDLANMVTNKYTFTVTKQDMHVDGNYSQLVTYDGGLVTDADPTYDKGDYPFTNYYKVAAVINNAVKGKIEITKEGEALVGFKEEKKDGYTILTPVFETVSKIKDAVFGIFAAKDENLNDGSEGPEIYDSVTNELITIPKTKSSHLSNAVESVKAFFGKLLNPKAYSAANYETGEYSHESGAELWYMLEREASEGNMKRTIYVSPEQKDTVYSYAYEATDGQFNYRWDIEVTMQNQAGGRNITNVSMTKITSAVDGYVTDIPLTQMTGSVGETVLDPIRNYMPITDPTDLSIVSSLDAYNKTYTFQADGTYENDWTGDGTTLRDFSNIGASRYTEKSYRYYKLKDSDLVTEERVVGQQEVLITPGVDANGDGDYDDPEDTAPVYGMEDVKETKTMFEWDNEGWKLVGSPAAGDIAILKNLYDNIYKTAVRGYYGAISAADPVTGDPAGTVKYTKLSDTYTFVETDNTGDPIAPYTVPEGWSLVTYTGNPETDAHYVIISKFDMETGNTVYRVLLDDMATWQECTPDGNFLKATVQVYEIKYTQEAGDANGFTLNWDGFALGSNVDAETNTATTIITKQANPVGNEVIDAGVGFEYEDEGDTITFRTIPIEAPIYFAWADGVTANMYYKGGVAYATISMPQSAVDHLYENIVPTLSFNYTDGDDNPVEMKLDWYSKLTPENPTAKFAVKDGLPSGCFVTATRRDSTGIGEETMYYIEIVTNQTEEKPLRLTFADGYTMDVYCAEAASGNSVGVIDLYNVYKTTRYTTSDLIEILTTDGNGAAESQLLPLGKYIVRELSSDDNYINDGADQVIELKYKDQFTPLIWGNASFDNEYMNVQLDLSKVFETAFKTDTYQPPQEGQSVKFGLYAAEKIEATSDGILSITKKRVKAGTLMDVITVDYASNGSILVNTKLPEGKYYLKELEAPDNYLMSGIRYNFIVREDDADYSADTTFDYTSHDGISGKFVLEEKNHVKTTVMVETRLPMPSIIIDGVSYPLDADFISEDGSINIDADSDFTEVTVDTFAENPTEITLPNGKVLKVKLGESGNTFDYTVDGVTNTFTPTVTYTGYYAGYEELWTPIAGEDLTTYTPEFTMTGAGSDKTSVILNAKITHEPSKTVTTRTELIDPMHPELGYTTVTVEEGNLTPGGNQIFKHSAVITVKDNTDSNVITASYQRKSGSTTVTETLDPSGEIELNPKDTITLNTLSGAKVIVSMDKYGVVTASIENTLLSSFADVQNPDISSTGAFGTGEFEFAKNVTLGRQDTSADKLMIKINSDNRDAFDVENDHKPEVKFVKVDKDDHTRRLSGARFEIYSAKSSGEWTVEPGQKRGEYTTGADGSFSAILNYGTYFYREISAPYGYTADYEFHKFRVIKGLSHYEFEVENTKSATPGTPGTPVTPKYLLEIIKQDMETGATLAGAEFELYGSSIVDGQVVRDETPLLKNLVTGAYGRLTIELDKEGTYFYRETKAPTGYTEDSEYHQVEIKNGTVVTKVVVNNEKIKDPMIKTTAKGSDGSSKITAGKSITIVDTVDYYNLTPGEKYVIKGTLMDKKTGKALTVNGKKVSAEKTFTAKAQNGTTTVKFTFDASKLGGHSLVVFEKLYLNGKLIAKHTDINDVDQTVKITPVPKAPAISTTASGSNGSKNIVANTSTVIIDKVKYFDLTKGKTYVLKGTLMDKNTGEVFTVDGKAVTATKTFVPTSESGYVKMKFTFDASGVEDAKNLVVFEQLYLDGKLIATHEDINDASQTVTISKVPKTGDNMRIKFFTLLALLSGGAATYLVFRRKEDEI